MGLIIPIDGQKKKGKEERRTKDHQNDGDNDAACCCSSIETGPLLRLNCKDTKNPKAAEQARQNAPPSEGFAVDPQCFDSSALLKLVPSSFIRLNARVELRRVVCLAHGW